jgi:hypothetical protein
MSPTDAVKKLKGSESDKRELFDFFIEKAMTGSIEEWEVIMLDALKRDLIPPEKKIIDMSASMKGAGLAGV